jgi:acyl-coenzyme A thioesterase PaaI-like protein
MKLDWNKGLFAHLGIELVEVGKDRIVATLEVRPELMTISDVVHGGTLMAFADTIGAAGTVANLASRRPTSSPPAVRGRCARSRRRCTRASARTSGRPASPTRRAGFSRSPRRPR